MIRVDGLLWYLGMGDLTRKVLSFCRKFGLSYPKPHSASDFSDPESSDPATLKQDQIPISSQFIKCPRYISPVFSSPQREILRG